MKTIKNYIYVTTNLINGKKYIGSHKGDETDSYFGSGKIIKYAIKKYGKHSFSKKILEECDVTNNLILEKHYINKFNTLYPNGYNLTENGGYNIFTDDLRNKLSNLKKGKISPNKGKRASEETRKKQSEAAKKRKRNPLSNETKEKIRQSNLGQKRSTETKKKLSESLTGRKLAEETKIKMSLFQKGRKKSNEEKEKLSKSKMGSNNPMFGKTPWNKGLKITK